MATTEKRTGCTRRGMILLGKIPSVPKPINLPSQRLENQGQGPDVEIVPRGTFSWGSAPRAAAKVSSPNSLSVHSNQENINNGGPQNSNSIANKAADSSLEKTTSHMYLSNGTSSGSDVSPPSSAGSSRSAGMSSISSHSIGSDSWNDCAKVHPTPTTCDDSKGLDVSPTKSCPSASNIEENSSSALDSSVKLKESGNPYAGVSDPSHESLNGSEDVQSQQNETSNDGCHDAQCPETEYRRNGYSEYPQFPQHNGPGMPYGPGMYPPHNGPYSYTGAPYYGGAKDREIVVIHMYSNPGYYGNYLPHPGFQEQYGRPGVYGHFPLQFGQFEPFLMPGQIIMDGAPQPPADMNTPFFSEQQHFVSYECERRDAEWVQGSSLENTSLIDNRDLQMKRTISAFETRSHVYRENVSKKVGRRKHTNRKPSVAVALQERRVTLLTKASRHEVIINSCYHDDGQGALGSFDSSSVAVIDDVPNTDCLCDSPTSLLETSMDKSIVDANQLMVESVRSPRSSRIVDHGEPPKDSIVIESSSDKSLVNAIVAELDEALHHDFSPAVDRKLSGDTGPLSTVIEIKKGCVTPDGNNVNVIKQADNNHVADTVMSVKSPVKLEVISTRKVNQSHNTTYYRNGANLKYKPRNMGFNQQKKVFVFKAKNNTSGNNMLQSSSDQSLSIVSGIAPKLSSDDARDKSTDPSFPVRPIQEESRFVQRDSAAKGITASAEAKAYTLDTFNQNKKEWRPKSSNVTKVDLGVPNLQVKVQHELSFQNRYRKKKTVSQLSQPVDMPENGSEGALLTSDGDNSQQNFKLSGVECEINQVNLASKNVVAESQILSLSVSAKEVEQQSLPNKVELNYKVDLPSEVVCSEIVSPNHSIASSIHETSKKVGNTQHEASWADRCTQEPHQKPHSSPSNELVNGNKLGTQTGKLHNTLKGSFGRSLTSQGSFYVSCNQKTVLKYRMTGRKVLSSHSENALKVKSNENRDEMQKRDEQVNKGESHSRSILAQGEMLGSNSKKQKHLLWKEKKIDKSENSNSLVNVEKNIQPASMQSSKPEIHGTSSTPTQNGNMHPVVKHSYKAVLEMQWPAVTASEKKIETCTTGKPETVGKEDHASTKPESRNSRKQEAAGKDDYASTKAESRNAAKISQSGTAWRPKTSLKKKDVKSVEGNENNPLPSKPIEGNTMKSPVPEAGSSSMHVSKNNDGLPYHDYRKHSQLWMSSKLNMVPHDKTNEGLAREIANVPPKKVKGSTSNVVRNHGHVPKQVVSVSNNQNAVHRPPFSSKSNFLSGESDRIYRKTVFRGMDAEKISSGQFNSKFSKSGQFTMAHDYGNRRGWVVKTKSGC